MKKPPKGLPVISSVEPAAGKGRWVKFHPERVIPALMQWGEFLLGQNTWYHPCHYFDGSQETLRWIFVVNVLNHCFWPDTGKPTWTVHYEGKSYSGYWGLVASLKGAVERGVRITDPTYLAEISSAHLRNIFLGEGDIPLFEERLSNLRETGRVILSRWRGDIIHLLEETRRSAVQTVKQVVSSFPSFQDEAQYRGKRVFFWKRAQLFVSDIHAAFAGQGWGRYDDIGELTAFADYKLPQVLRELGILSYHPELAAKVDRKQNLTSASEEEVEIRFMTIWAVEALKEAFGRGGREVTGAQVDQWLWQLGQLKPFRRRPYHRCRTIFY